MKSSGCGHYDLNAGCNAILDTHLEEEGDDFLFVLHVECAYFEWAMFPPAHHNMFFRVLFTAPSFKIFVINRRE